MILCWQRKNHLHLYWIRWPIQPEKKAIILHHSTQSNSAEWKWIRTFLFHLHHRRPIWRKLHLVYIQFAYGRRKRSRPPAIGQIVRENDASDPHDECWRWTTSSISLFCFLFIRWSVFSQCQTHSSIALLWSLTHSFLVVHHHGMNAGLSRAVTSWFRGFHHLCRRYQSSVHDVHCWSNPNWMRVCHFFYYRALGERTVDWRPLVFTYSFRKGDGETLYS